MCCYRFLFLHFLLTCHSYLLVLFQRNILTFTCFLYFLYTVWFFNVALIVVVVIAVAVVDAAVGSAELQRERERDSLSAV